MAENSRVGLAGGGRFCGPESGSQHPAKKSDGCSPWSPNVLGFGWGSWEELDCCFDTESLLGVSIWRLLRKGVGAFHLSYSWS